MDCNSLAGEKKSASRSRCFMDEGSENTDQAELASDSDARRGLLNVTVCVRASRTAAVSTSRMAC